MTRLARAGRATVAVVSGLAVVGVLGATAAVGDQWVGRWTGATQAALDAGTREVPVEPAELPEVCPPPVRLPDGADVGDDQFDAAPVRTRTTLGAAVAGATELPGLTALDGSGEDSLTEGTGAAVASGPVDGVRVLRAQPSAVDPLRASAAVASLTTAGDLRGLAAASCATPSTSHWLVGGSSEVGASALLAVQNPSPRPASVALEVFGPSGRVAVGGQSAFTVAPGEQVVTRLDSLAPEQRRLAVHVRATGARVTTSLQSQGIDGLVPAGTDLVEAGAAPTTTLAVSGVLSRGEATDDDHAATMWLLAPDEPGAADVRVYGPDGRVTLRGAEEVPLAAGDVVGVPLGGLEPGAYTVVVDADVPVVGAARFAVPGALGEDAVVEGTPFDVAWSAGRAVGAPDEPASGQVALPGGADGATLVLAGVPADRGADDAPDGEVVATVRGLGEDGAVAAEREVTVPVGGTVELPAADVGAVTAVTVDTEATGDASLAWSVRLTAADAADTADALVATLDPTPTVVAPGSVAVRRIDAW
ncbi:hypothetical protein BCE75_10630 [Isoptericola sp. CG 20/1183]|uniref:Large extracellular alpha-helical protein n=1 Tax=Isoptericola halotolerans TaxID=300560 RepID=A0ABX5EDT3_9MICO|nr:MULTISPECIES: DUF5719 family protein [Isoptericola]PRZ06529.1 hypothetical protein BCL65_106204 [Isoptericola halotolerans]PRZ06665.1 hypothetical protein BCE75_10630 [Isoptericola sp. CG 20/1183]